MGLRHLGPGRGAPSDVMSRWISPVDVFPPSDHPPAGRGLVLSRPFAIRRRARWGISRSRLRSCPRPPFGVRRAKGPPG
eukprot:scaffold7851_cov323-Prasinococcus_capsulatus_cf.AAC.4